MVQAQNDGEMGMFEQHLQKFFPGGSAIKNPPACAGDAGDAGSIPGQEDPLGKGMATHSSILAWEISWTEEPGRLQSMGTRKSRTQLSN